MTPLGRGGLAIPFVLIVLMVLLAVGHGVLALALEELRVGRLAGMQLEGRLSAEGALTGALLGGAEPGWEYRWEGAEEVVLSGVGPPGGVPARIRLRPLEEGFLLLVAEVEFPGGIRRLGPGRVAWSLPSGLLPSGVSATVVSPSPPRERDGGRVVGGGWAGGDCPGTAGGVHLFPVETPRWATPPGGGGGLPRLGPFTVPELLTFLPGATGEVRFAGGDHEGLLLVDGDLRVEGGAEYRGLALVTGMVTLSGSSTWVGTLAAGGMVTVEAGSRLEGSPCAVAAVLAELPLLSRPRPLPGGSWVGPF